MKINRALNIVITRDDVQVHACPISRMVFEQFYRVIAKAFTSIFQQGASVIAGPRIAHLELLDAARELDRLDEVQAGLVGEIVRLANVFMPGDVGWKTVPLQTAIDQKMLDDDLISDIMGQLVFFTCVSSMNTRSQIPAMLETAGGLWGLRATPSSCTEYQSSLPTSTAAENTGATATT